MGKPTVIPEKIHLQAVRIMKSHFEVSETENQSEIESFSMGFKSEAGFDLKNNQHRFSLFVKIKGINKDDEYVGVKGEYHIDFFYLVENLEDFIHWEEGKEGMEENGDNFTVSQMLGATIAGISYSTSRGIILDRTQATDFNGILLPVINPNHLLTEDSFTDL